ncbi:MAG TPA: cell division protein FtsB [Oceanospirillaceae bacterium]|nr:cell division protein FtsB [Oceanospirillaceae bacterium]
MRAIAIFLFVAALMLQYQYWFGETGQVEVRALQNQITQQQAVNEALHQRNQQLYAEVEDLKQGLAAVEERARSDLGMLKPQETFYQLVEQQ